MYTVTKTTLPSKYTVYKIMHAETGDFVQCADGSIWQHTNKTAANNLCKKYNEIEKQANRENA